MHVPGTRITDPYSYQITENTYPYQRHVPVSAHCIDTPPPPTPIILINHKNMKFILEAKVVPFKISIFGIKKAESLDLGDK